MYCYRSTQASATLRTNGPIIYIATMVKNFKYYVECQLLQTFADQVLVILYVLSALSMLLIVNTGHCVACMLVLPSTVVI